MNTQRREEIRALITDQDGTHAMEDYRAALIDAMDWIDQLEAKAAERVISDGTKGPVPDYAGEGSAWVPPKIKPHIFAKMVNEVRDLARQYGQVEQFRCRVADLLGKYIHVEHNSKGVPEQVEAPAVVLPELTAEEREDIFPAPDLAENEQGYREFWRVFDKAFAIASSRARAIPAERVLGKGEVKMEICERDCREDDEDALEVLRVCGYGQQAEMLEVAIKAHDLRANQGGSAT